MIPKLLPEFCTILIKSRARNFLHGDIWMIYQQVKRSKKTPPSESLYFTAFSEVDKKPYQAGFQDLLNRGL